MIRRPVLAPGPRPLRLPSGDLLFGAGTEHRLRVPDTPAVRRAVEILERGETLPDTAEMRRARSALAPVLRDGGSLLRPGLAPGEVAAVALRHPRSATDRLDARQRATIRVEGDLGTDVGPLLDAVGLGRARPEDPRPSAVLVLSRGEPDRERLDELVRTGIPHLVVRALGTDVALGPFVLPGITACLRCCDLHQRTVDPTYDAVLTALGGTPRRDGVADPVPSPLAWIALGWAVNDLVHHVEADLPSTSSAVVVLRPDDTSFAARYVAAHAACGCRWPSGTEEYAASVTMEA